MAEERKEQSFWDALGPGLLQTGGNIFLGRQASKQAEDRLRTARGPLYDQTQRMASDVLSKAQGFDPQKMASERFAAQQALVAPTNEADMQQLMQRLQRQGMLEMSSYAPVPGTVSTPGQAMNPQMAALFAAQQGAKSRAAYESLGEGERYLDSLMNRSGMLTSQAANRQTTGLQAQATIPPRPSAASQIVQGGMNILKDPRARTAVTGMLGSGLDWLRNLGGGGGGGWTGGTAYDYSFDF